MKTGRGNGNSCVVICDLCDVLWAVCLHYECAQRNRNVLYQSLFRISVLDKKNTSNKKNGGKGKKERKKEGRKERKKERKKKERKKEGERRSKGR